MANFKQNHHQSAIDHSPFGYAFHRIVYDEKGKPVDYEFLEVNPAFEKITGLDRKQILHKTARELFPAIKDPGFDWIGTYASVASTGKATEFEQLFLPLNRWFRIFASSPEKGYFSVVVIDITTEKANQHKLQESETKFSAAFQKAPFAMALTAVETGFIEDINEAFLELLGYSKEELTGKSTLELGLWADPDDRDEVLQSLKEGRPVVSKEIRIRNKSGKISYGLFSASVIHINDKPYIISTNEDITERKNALAELNDNHAKFFTVFHQSPHTITISDLETSRIVDVNKAFERDSGYTREEAIGNSIVGLNLWVNLDEREQVMNDLKNGRKVVGREYQFRRKDGSLIYGNLSASFCSIANRLHTLTSIEDITIRKKAEEALRESEEKFSRAFRLAPFSITLTDGETQRLVEVNEAFVRSTGYSREEALSNSSAGLNLWYSNEDRAAVISDLMQGIPVRGREYKFRNKDGSLIYGSFSATVIHIQNKPYVLGSIEDITEKKALSASLEKELAFRKYLFDNAKEGYALFDSKQKLIEANDRFCKMLGYDPNELDGIYAWDFEANLSKQDVQNLFDQSEVFANIYETTHRRTDGLHYQVEVNAWGFEWEGESVVFCAYRDITAKKFMENKLKESEERLRSLVANISEVLFELDTNGIISYMSTVVESFTGMPADTYINKHFSCLVHPDDLERAVEDFQGLATANMFDTTYKVLTQTGQAIPVGISIIANKRNGSVYNYRGVARKL